MFVLLWVLFTLLIIVWAKRWNHSVILWGITSLIISPLITGVILLIVGSAHPKCPSCKEVVKSGSRICKHCGQKFKESTT
ncbi:zinc ribbon domain-containing protein [Thalassotalea sp. LPB0316]|uniref:zinc ribbon domain-containing protein n=1 Tax=Thalassotalea sp. LPB0316 TaxID=2769490 RepID=UPI001868B63F|nr:zinc ribbon domain-containing protein [Thalassotalea sp. LPB0316]